MNILPKHFWLILVVLTSPVQAKLHLFDVAEVVQAPALPSAPAYEIVSGTFTGELDPADPHNAIITDIALAPRNAKGLVEYRATFKLARPTDPTKASGVLFYDVPNRGMGGVGADPDGHLRVISGWQGDIPPSRGAQTLDAPLAKGVTGPALARFTNLSASAKDVAIMAGFAVPVPRPLPVSLDSSQAKLWLETRDGKRTVIPASDWAFADCRAEAFPGTPDPRRLCLKAAFDPDAAYSLVYQAKDPIVLGIGFAATRDLVAFLHAGKPDDLGHPNPANAPVRWTVAAGNSQSGNYLRSFIHLGFNQDETGARVFDGVNANIAARQVPLNIRFGVPGGAAGTYEAGSEGTLWWAPYDDRLRRLGKTSFLTRCMASKTCPKIVETFGSAEFWGLRASPGLVGTDAKADIPLPANVRRYYSPSVTHGGGSGGFSTIIRPAFGNCLLPSNPNPSAPVIRAAIRALVDWVVTGKEPPASRYPTLANGDLVVPTAKAIGWPSIPSAPKPDGHYNHLPIHHYGPGYLRQTVSGVLTQLPPVIQGEVPILVPRVNADGNEESGIPSVQLQVPLGTYTGWNIEAAGIDKGHNCGFNGGFIPFAKTKAEREATHDPRLSLEERYGDHAGFVAKIKAVVAKEQAAGWLLADDAAKVLVDAEASTVLR